MTYRAIYSDIDGTLLNRAHRMSPRTLAITRRLAQAGIPIILVSARPPLAITPFTDAIGGKQPLIAFNGALILDGDLNELYSVTLDNAAKPCWKTTPPLPLSTTIRGRTGTAPTRITSGQCRKATSPACVRQSARQV